LRNIRERLFPPTWVEALRQLKKSQIDPAAFAIAPVDLLHDFLVPTPDAFNADDAEEEFRVWFFYRHEFGKLLCIYDAMSHVAVALNLTESSEPEFPSAFEIAARILNSTGDREMALVCLDVMSHSDDGHSKD